MDELFRAMQNPLRREIVETLKSREMSVEDLKDVLGIGKSYLSQQLAILRQAKVLRREKRGLYVFYTVDTETLEKMRDYLNSLI